MKETEKLKALLVIVSGLLVFYLIFDKAWLVYTATGVGVISLMIPALGTLLIKGWFKLAELLGWVNSRIILSVVYFIFLLPLALLSRLSKKNPLSLKRQEASLFHNRDHKYSKEDLENIW